MFPQIDTKNILFIYEHNGDTTASKFIYTLINKICAVSSSILSKKMHSILLYVVISLSIIALIAELLPEVKAKMIVIPTLVLTIALSIFEIKQRRIVNSR